MNNEERVYCQVSGKVCYTSKEASLVITKIKNSKNIRRSKHIPKRKYYCPHCGFYHLTHYNSLQTCKVTLRRYGAKGLRDKFGTDEF